jgi:hypothetical protein
MDSEDRFYATLFMAYGAALLWCIKDIERKSKVVYFLALTFFAGGLARLISMAVVGLPNAFFITMTGLELFLSLVIAFMQSRISVAPIAQPAVPAPGPLRGSEVEPGR